MRVSTLLLSSAALVGASSLRVCSLEDIGYDMRRAGVAEKELYTDDELRGYDVEVRKHVLAGYNYSVRLLSSYGELMTAVRDPDYPCDVGWAIFFASGKRDACDPQPASSLCRPLDQAALAALNGSGTSPPADGWAPYRCCIDFSFPFISLDIGIMYKSHQLSNFNAILVKVIFEPFVANYLSLLFLWVVLVAHLMWASERRVNDDEFPRTYLDGIDDAVWWAIVTVTTVGYGDKSPKSPTGRVIAMIWMILGLFIFSVLSGHMSSRFVELQSVSTINGVRDLSGLRVCSYYGNFELAHYFPDSIEMQPVEANDVRACGELLRSGDVDAVVMEMGLMAYYARNDPWATTQELSFSPAIASVPSGVIFAEGDLSPSAMALNRELSTKLMEFSTASPSSVNLKNEWLGPPLETTNHGAVQWSTVIPALVILGIYLLANVLYLIDRRLGLNLLPEVQCCVPSRKVATETTLARQPSAAAWQAAQGMAPSAQGMTAADPSASPLSPKTAEDVKFGY